MAAAVIDLIIFGDSLSAPGGCAWPQYLEPYAIIRNYAQAGLDLRDFTFPQHLRMKDGSKAVIYIGGNDALHSRRLDHYRFDLAETVSRLQFRGAEVYLVGQPYIAGMEPYRAVTEGVAIEYGAKYIEPQWGPEDTTDGVHPTCMTHAFLALHLYGELGL